MFGLVSKKKCRGLEERCRGLEERCRQLDETLGVKRWEYMRRAREEAEALEQLSCVMKQNAALATELREYKQKYADEVQKRLELAEMVKALEEGAGGNGEGKMDSAAGAAEG